MHRVEIMRPGQFTPMAGQAISFTEDTLRLAAVTYDAAKAPAPVVIGHPETNAPAYGWVKGMDFADGTLGAYLGDLAPSFAEAVKDKRYTKVSASFFPPQSSANPRPGVFYLRHVGFLGAAAPAVPGLRPVSFASAEGEALDFAHDAAAFAVADAEASVMGRMLAKLASMEAREREERRREAVAFCDDLIQKARLPMALRELAIAAVAAAPGVDAISFGEGDRARSLAPGDAVKELLRSLPPMVMFGEHPRAREPLPDDLAAQMELPEGYAADRAGLELAARATALAAKDGIAFADAVRQLSRGR